MEIAIEQDPVDALDREEERAIAAFVRARFGKGGDLDVALRSMTLVTDKRLRLRARQAVRRSA